MHYEEVAEGPEKRKVINLPWERGDGFDIQKV